MFTETEQKLLDTLTECCNVNHIEVRINEIPKKIDGPVALDVEHDESGNFVGCGICFSNNGLVYYFSDICTLSRLPFEALNLICHNGISDFECLRQWGIDVKDHQLVWDSELIQHILDSSLRGYGLKKLANEFLGISYPSYDDIVGKRTEKQLKARRTLDKCPVEIVSRYNALDCFVTYKLYERQAGRSNVTTVTGPLASIVRYFKDIERPIAAILNDMSNRGVRVDLGYLEGLKRELEAQKRPLEEAIKNELGDINLNSPKQLLGALHAKEIYPELKGKASTDKRALERFRDRAIINQLLQYSELDTLLSSFVIPYLERNTEVVHPFFNQCGTRTGRLSCSNPNLLQIPRKTNNGRIVRNMFIPRSGMELGEADYAAIEPRVLAHLSGDPNLRTLFNKRLDFHSWTAERLNITRDKAKVLNLSVGYRATFKSVMAQLGCDKDEAQEQIDKWWALFPVLRRWQDKLIYDSQRSGFCTTLMGRRIKIDGLRDGNSWKREASERQLINNITQGSAAEIMKMAMIKIKKTSPILGLLIQIYDSLVFESDNINRDSLIVTKCMESAVKLEIPLVVDLKTGFRWGEMK